MLPSSFFFFLCGSLCQEAPCAYVSVVSMPLEWIHTTSMKLFFSRSPAHAVATYCLKDPFEKGQPLTSIQRPPLPGHPACHSHFHGNRARLFSVTNACSCIMKTIGTSVYVLSCCQNSVFSQASRVVFWNASHHTPHYTLPPFTSLPKAQTSFVSLTPLLKNGPNKHPPDAGNCQNCLILRSLIYTF